MTAQPIQAVLDPGAAKLLFATLSHPAGAAAQDIAALRAEALDWLAELAPRDRVQSALAVRVIGFHHAMLHHLAKAREEIGEDLALRHAGRAATATRMMDRALAALQGRQMMAPMRAVALPAGIGEVAAETVPPAPEVTAPVTVTKAEAAPAVEAKAAPREQVATPVVAPAEAEPPIGSSGWVARRLADLDAKLARGEELTAAQTDWRRRQLARQAEAAATALAA